MQRWTLKVLAERSLQTAARSFNYHWSSSLNSQAVKISNINATVTLKCRDQTLIWVQRRRQRTVNNKALETWKERNYALFFSSWHIWGPNEMSMTCFGQNAAEGEGGCSQLSHTLSSAERLRSNLSKVFKRKHKSEQIQAFKHIFSLLTLNSN